MSAKVLILSVSLAVLVLPQAVPPQSLPPVAGWWRLVTTSPPPNTPSQLVVRGPNPFSEFVLNSWLPDRVEYEALGLDPARAGIGFETRLVGNALVFTRPPHARSGAAPAMPARQESWSVDATGRLRIEIVDRWPAGAEVRAEVFYEKAVPEARRGVNLLTNPDASAGRAGWLAFNDAKVEACEGNPCLVVRNGGTLQQSVLLSGDAPGQFALVIGSGANERVGDSTTGRGLVSCQFMYAGGVRYIGGTQSLRANSPQPNAWVTMSGVFPIPAGAAEVVCRLTQGAQRDVPQNGSASRFDDLGLFVFATESEARAFVERWKGRQE